MSVKDLENLIELIKADLSQPKKWISITDLYYRIRIINQIILDKTNQSIFSTQNK